MLHYLKIVPTDTKNGWGFRCTIWFSGCKMNPKCEGCFSPSTWDCNNGTPFTSETEKYILQCCEPDYIKGLSVTGGNPTDLLDDGQLLHLVKTFKEVYPEKDIICWSGNTYEELIIDDKKLEFLSYIDYLRDGRFIKGLFDKTQYLEGSKNQRLINVQESLKIKEIVLYEDIK